MSDRDARIDAALEYLLDTPVEDRDPREIAYLREDELAEVGSLMFVANVLREAKRAGYELDTTQEGRSDGNTR